MGIKEKVVAEIKKLELDSLHPKAVGWNTFIELLKVAIEKKNFSGGLLQSNLRSYHEKAGVADNQQAKNMFNSFVLEYFVAAIEEVDNGSSLQEKVLQDFVQSLKKARDVVTNPQLTASSSQQSTATDSLSSSSSSSSESSTSQRNKQYLEFYKSLKKLFKSKGKIGEVIKDKKAAESNLKGGGATSYKLDSDQSKAIRAMYDAAKKFRHAHKASGGINAEAEGKAMVQAAEKARQAGKMKTTMKGLGFAKISPVGEAIQGVFNKCYSGGAHPAPQVLADQSDVQQERASTSSAAFEKK